MRNHFRFRPALERLEERAVLSTLAPGFAESVVVAGLTNPTSTAVAPDGRLFVTEQGGTVRVVTNGVLSAPILSLSVDSAGERGLLGLEFDPNFASNGFFYVYYTVPGTPAHNRVSRFTFDGTSAGSEHAILDLDDLSSATNHNGGALHFGGDGKLYVAVGENNNPANAQTLANRLGKILRINADGSIPADNPLLVMTTGANQAIYALGLRNPFTFAFRPGTNQFFINDVGQAAFEEINQALPGANYGWNLTEGFQPPGVAGVTYPVYAYAHGAGNFSGQAITGGAFGPAGTAFAGGYYFADLTNKWVNRLDLATGQVTNLVTDLPFAGTVDLDFDAAGNLLITTIGFGSTGQVIRVSFTGLPPSPPPPAVAPPPPATSPLAAVAASPLLAGFSKATGDVDGDGVADLVVAAGPGSPPVVGAFSGATGALLFTFSAFPPTVTAGVSLAVADVNGDGLADIITSLGAGAPPVVQVFSLNGGLIRSFYAFSPGFSGGVTLAAGDLDGDGKAEVIAGTASGGGQVNVFSGATGRLTASLFPFGGFAGGVTVAAGDVNGDGKADVLAGVARGPALVVAYNGADLGMLMAFLAAPPSFLGGVRVGVSGGDILVAAGSGPSPGLLFDGRAGTLKNVIAPFDPSFLGAALGVP